MLRGYGACDRSAWVFVAIAQQLGYDAVVVVLWDQERDVSPHALASVLLPGGLALFDTHVGLALEVAPQGDFATIDDVIENPELLSPFEEAGLGSSVRAEFFEHAIITMTYEPSGVFPRTAALQKMADAIPGGPRFYFDVARDLYVVLDKVFGGRGEAPLEFPYGDPRKPYVVHFWVYPFDVRRVYRDPDFVAAVAKTYGPDLSYRAARVAQLTGNYETAVRRYQSLLETVEDDRARQDMRYFVGATRFEMGDFEGAVDSLRAYVSAYPRGAWYPSAEYHLGRSYEAMGVYDEALSAYQRVQGDPISMNARARERALAGAASPATPGSMRREAGGITPFRQNAARSAEAYRDTSGSG